MRLMCIVLPSRRLVAATYRAIAVPSLAAALYRGNARFREPRHRLLQGYSQG